MKRKDSYLVQEFKKIKFFNDQLKRIQNMSQNKLKHSKGEIDLSKLNLQAFDEHTKELHKMFFEITPEINSF